MRETPITKIADLDAEDAAFVANYIAQRAASQGPQVGDFIEFVDGKISRIIGGDADTIGTNQSWNGGLGEVHISPHGARFGSYSSGPSVPRDLIKATGKVLPGVFWFFHHQYPHPDGIGVEIPCRVFQQIEGTSKLMCWTSCNCVCTSIHGYQVKEEQRWEAQWERDGQQLQIGEFPDWWGAERACERHHAETRAPGTGKHMYWNRNPRVHASRHGYRAATGCPGKVRTTSFRGCSLCPTARETTRTRERTPQRDCPEGCRDPSTAAPEKDRLRGLKGSCPGECWPALYLRLLREGAHGSRLYPVGDRAGMFSGNPATYRTPEKSMIRPGKKPCVRCGAVIRAGGHYLVTEQEELQSAALETQQPRQVVACVWPVLPL